MHCSLTVLALILLYGGHCFSVVLCNTIDTTRYRNTKVGIDTQKFGIEVSEYVAQSVS